MSSLKKCWKMACAGWRAETKATVLTGGHVPRIVRRSEYHIMDNYQSFLDDFIQMLHSGAYPVAVAAIGGSAATTAMDTYSDLDLFIFCEDRHLPICIGGICHWIESNLGPGTCKVGPVLRDEFGVGFRFARDQHTAIDAFFMTESMWIPAPAQGKAHIIFARGEAGAWWQQRIQACRDEQFDSDRSDRYVSSFCEQHVLTWFQKIEKYCRRSNYGAATWFCLRAGQALVAAERYLDDGAMFEPDCAFRILHSGSRPTLYAEECAAMHLAVSDPPAAFCRLVDRARRVAQKLPHPATLLPRLSELHARLPALLQEIRGPSREARSPRPPLSQDVARLSDINRRHWEEVSRKHPDTSYYAVQAVRDGHSSLSAIEHAELPSLIGLEGVHLECGIGLDTLSLARQGARMHGVDFSGSAVVFARTLARECAVDAAFSVGDILDAATLPARSFDFAYTSHGALRWLPSLDAWAANVYSLIRPGGFLYVFDIHPLVFRLSQANAESALLVGDYFDETPKIKQRTQTHTGVWDQLDHSTLVHTDWTVSRVINGLIAQGLRISFYHEHAGTSYSRKGLLSRKIDHLWYPEASSFPIPLAFSIMAIKN